MIVGAGIVFERHDPFLVKRERRFAAVDRDIAFVKFQANVAGDRFLRLFDHRFQDLELRREPKSVIDRFGEFDAERVAQAHNFAIHRDRFKRTVRRLQDRHARSFVNAARFHTDKAILDKIDAADSVLAADEVEF